MFLSDVMSFTNGELASEAVKFLRQKDKDSGSRKFFPLKSENKGCITKDAIERQRVAGLALAMTRTGAYPDFEFYGSHVMNNSAGANCQEYSFAALSLIRQRGGKAALFTSTLADHSVCVVGAQDHLMAFDLRLPRMGNTWICDPWANIACRIFEYPFMMSQQLEKWGSENKMIYWNGSWRNANDSVYKSSLTQATFKSASEGSFKFVEHVLIRCGANTSLQSIKKPVGST